MAQQIYELIPKIMASVGAIEKNRKNLSQNYAFRGIDDVCAAFQQPLARHGVFYIPEVLDKQITDRQSAKGGTLIYTSLTVAYTFYAPDGSSVRAVVVGEAMDSGDKSSNKAMSAALKYALLQIFCVPTEAQEDADYESHEVATTKEQAAFNAQKPLLDPMMQKRVSALIAICRRDGSTFYFPHSTGAFKVERNEMGKVCCNCQDFIEGIALNSNYRCEHIHAAKEFAAKQQPSGSAA